MNAISRTYRYKFLVISSAWNCNSVFEMLKWHTVLNWFIKFRIYKVCNACQPNTPCHRNSPKIKPYFIWWKSMACIDRYLYVRSFIIYLLLFVWNFSKKFVDFREVFLNELYVYVQMYLIYSMPLTFFLLGLCYFV